MRILFVENKYKTLFYKELSNELTKYGHESYFLIQNKVFSTGKTECFINSTFSSKMETPELEALFLKCLDKVSKSDRNLNYFGGNSAHYKAYFYNVYQAIDEINPNVVFGESTLFHELITIFICKSRGIRYLHPCSCRIPSQRFSFYIGDSLIPYYGSEETATNEFCSDIVDSFGYRKKTLDYMLTPSRIEAFYKKGRLIRNWLMGVYSRLLGEKYNTPSLRKKVSLQRDLKKHIKMWESYAQNQLLGDNKKVLYPLHMQPECNVDVWSVEFRDQVKTISNISKILPSNWELIVKPNPKSKYEMNLDLIKVCSTLENITLLNHAVKMQDITDDIDLFITASGTVAYECFLTNKPCLSLALPFFEDNSSDRHLKSLDWDEIYSKYLKQNEISNSSPKNLVSYLLRSSYIGVISDPISTPSCIYKENLQIVAKSFERILRHIKKEEDNG